MTPEQLDSIRQRAEAANHAGLTGYSCDPLPLLAEVNLLNAELAKVRPTPSEADGFARLCDELWRDFDGSSKDFLTSLETAFNFARAGSNTELAEARRERDEADRRGWQRGWDEAVQRQIEFDNRICQFIPERYEANYNPIEEWVTDAAQVVLAALHLHKFGVLGPFPGLSAAIEKIYPELADGDAPSSSDGAGRTDEVPPIVDHLRWPLLVSCPACGAPERVWCFKAGIGHALNHVHDERRDKAASVSAPAEEKA